MPEYPSSWTIHSLFLWNVSFPQNIKSSTCIARIPVKLDHTLIIPLKCIISTEYKNHLHVLPEYPSSWTIHSLFLWNVSFPQNIKSSTCIARIPVKLDHTLIIPLKCIISTEYKIIYMYCQNTRQIGPYTHYSSEMYHFHRI